MEEKQVQTNAKQASLEAREQKTYSDEAHLVALLKEGEEKAFHELISRFQEPVYLLAYRLLGDSDEASDVVQEVFLKVFRHIDSFDEKSSLKTWLYRITVNQVLNQRRWFKRHRMQETELDRPGEDGTSFADRIVDARFDPYRYVLSREYEALVKAALEHLSPVLRAAVVLRDIEGLSYEEIAEILDVSVGTVKSRIGRGREALRQQLIRLVETTTAAQPAIQLAD